MLATLHILISAALAFCIVVQTRASGLSSTFGGSGGSFQIQRRGAEKLVFKATIWLSVVFFSLSILRWYL